MTTKEVEEKTGLLRSNIRFYEKEKLLEPARNGGSGYREYSEQDVEEIKKIAYLRTLGISIENIRKIIRKEVPLYEAVKNQLPYLDDQIADLQNARAMCKKLLSSGEVTFEKLEIETYVPDVKSQWKRNKNIFKKDSVSFLYLWGGTVTWGLLTAVSLLAALVSFSHLPSEIPIQWSGGTASSTVPKGFIFAYPAACAIIRFLLRPFIWRWLQINTGYGDSAANYISNYLCFAAVSVEIFTILFLNGTARYVSVVLVLDTVVLIGLLLLGGYRMTRKSGGKTSG